MITLINRQRTIPIDLVWLHSLVEAVLTITEYDSFDVQILLTTNKTIRSYNETYRGKKGATDILSFRYYPEQLPGKKVFSPTGEQNIGDLVLSPQYIVKSAQTLDVTFEHRLMILIIHGIVHLLGYDHETDNEYKIMQGVEDKILLKIPPSLKRS